MQNEFSSPHIYDYIRQNQVDQVRAAIQPKGPEYQVPPPPRPVVLQNREIQPKDVASQKSDAYLDMTRSGNEEPLPSQPSSSSRRKANSMGIFPSANFLFGRSNKREDAPTYQEPISPPKAVQTDPFGTLRASFKGQKINGTKCQQENENDDDVFLPASKSNSQEDPFGTFKANSALTHTSADALVDYREGNIAVSGNGLNRFESELAITNELLQLLEEFKNNPCSLKDMELRFEQWRRKALLKGTSGNIQVYYNHQL